MDPSALPPSSSAPQETAGAAPARSRIFIVDDHAMFREGLCQLLDREPDLTVCGEAAEADEALKKLPEAKPDLVIVDISLPNSSGIELIKAIRSQFEELPVLVVSMHDESLYAERAMRAGAMGYVMKQEPSKTVKTAVRKVLGGDIHLSEKMASSLIARFMRGSPGRAPSPLETLSDRELQVFRKLGEGKRVREIAGELGVTIATVNWFRNQIKEKLGLKNSTDVMLHAIQWVQEDPARTVAGV
jgi:DNA-binding NarL/FixJ family response regulator